jgi:exodeoxyribonuclease-3
MRIISWNCRGAYHKKIDKIIELDPDIAVIQECENLEKLRVSSQEKIPLKSYWFGGFYKPRGVGVFFYKDYEILSTEYDTSIEFIIPMKIRNNQDFYLFAVWAMAPKDKKRSYTYQIERALERYKAILKNNDSILIGDYNSPHIEKPNELTGVRVVELFKKLGIFSAYHEFHKKEYGEHNHPTFYCNKKRDFPHMLDYCFASKSTINNICKVDVGRFEDWIKYSDHCPLIIDIKAASRK